jgi:hypothetical protein
MEQTRPVLGIRPGNQHDPHLTRLQKTLNLTDKHRHHTTIQIPQNFGMQQRLHQLTQARLVLRTQIPRARLTIRNIPPLRHRNTTRQRLNTPRSLTRRRLVMLATQPLRQHVVIRQKPVIPRMTRKQRKTRKPVRPIARNILRIPKPGRTRGRRRLKALPIGHGTAHSRGKRGEGSPQVGGKNHRGGLRLPTLSRLFPLPWPPPPPFGRGRWPGRRAPAGRGGCGRPSLRCGRQCPPSASPSGGAAGSAGFASVTQGRPPRLCGAAACHRSAARRGGSPSSCSAVGGCGKAHWLRQAQRNQTPPTRQKQTYPAIGPESP